jgi:hypothetical protein
MPNAWDNTVTRDNPAFATAETSALKGCRCGCPLCNVFDRSILGYSECERPVVDVAGPECVDRCDRIRRGVLDDPVVQPEGSSCSEVTAIQASVCAATRFNPSVGSAVSATAASAGAEKTR